MYLYSWLKNEPPFVGDAVSLDGEFESGAEMWMEHKSKY